MNIFTAQGCVDIVYSPDDGGWYGHQYDFSRKDSATRTTRRIYPSRDDLLKAIREGKARWTRWS